MAASKSSVIKNTINMKARKLISLLTILILSTCSLFSQSYLILVNAPLNQYPITFTDVAQQQLVLNFTKNVTPGANISQVGWSIAGTAATITRIDAIGTNVLITLSTAITYAERLNVKVTYNAATGNFLMQDGTEPLTLTNIGAVNNAYPTQADFSNGLYGENPPVDICAAVLNVSVTSNLLISARYRNSIYFHVPRMSTLWMYPSPVPKTEPDYVETGGVGTGIFNKTNIYAAYPDNTINCTWVISIFPYIIPQAPAPGLSVTDRQVFITIPNYKKDNGTPVPGTGDLGLDPPVDDPRTLFCVGENITNFIFRDATVFDCQLPVEPNLPNTQPRNVQFVYGTQIGAGIPNVFINVNGTPVQVTDNTGVSISGVWHVNPDGSPNIPGYTTPSGFFEGPVVQYLWDSGTKLLITPMIQTYPISHTGDFVNDAAGDIFDVTLRNWGPCNPYDGMDPFTYLQAVTEFSRLRLVLSPPLPTAPNVTICLGSSTALTASRNGVDPAGVLHWYSDAALTTEVATGTSYNPGIPIPLGSGVYNYWVREIVTGGCKGPAKLVVLTINPKPAAAIAPATPAEQCKGGTINLNGTPTGGTVPYSHAWTGTGSGDLSAANIVNPVYTAPAIIAQTVYGLTYTVTDNKGCTATSSISVTVNPNITSGITPAAATELCPAATVNLSGNRAGGTAPYTHSWTGSGAAYLNFTNIETPVFTAPVVGVQTVYALTYTVTDSKGCISTSSKNITVNPKPAAAIAPATPAEQCKGGTINLNGTPSGGTGAYTHLWTGTGSGNLSASNIVNPVYTAPAIIAQTIYGLTYTVTDTKGCTATNSISVTVNPNITSGITPAAATELCPAATVNLSGNRAGGTAPYTHSWTGSGAAYLNFTNIETPVFTAPVVGVQTVYALTYTVTDSKGCISTSSKNITVNPKPAAAIAPATPAEQCKGGTINLNGTPSGGTGAYTHLWTGTGSGNLSASNIVNPVYTAPSIVVQTVYGLTYKVTDTKGCTATSSISVTVNPNITSGITPAAATELCPAATVNLSGNRGGGTAAYTHSWTGSGAAYLNFTNIETPVFTAPVVAVQTVYALTYTVTDSKGCISTSSKNITVNPKPAAAIAPATPAEQCKGGTINLNGTPTGGTVPYSHAWTGTGSGNLSAANIVNPVYTAPSIAVQTIYGLTYTVTDNKGCTATNSISVTVNPNITSGITPAAATELCPAATVNLSGNRGGGTAAYTHSWTGSGAAYLNFTNIETPVFTAPVVAVQTVYALTYTVTDSKGCISTSSKNITVNPKPAAAIAPATPAEQCKGGTINLNGTPTGGTVPYSHAWTGTGSGNLSAANIVNPVYTAPSIAVQTIYGLTYTVTDTKGCSATNSVSITVNPNITAGITPVAAIALCTGSTVNLSGNRAGGTAAYTHVWTGSGAAYLNFTNIETPVFTAPVVGIPTVYTVIYTVTDSKGCVATDSKTITVNPSAPGPAGAISGSSPVCFGQSGVTYSILAVPTASNYVWTVPAGVSIVSGQGTISLKVDFTALAVSPVSISVYPENGCGPGNPAQTISVIITPTVGTPTAITTSGDPACQLTNGTTTTTYSTTATNNTGFNWSLSSALAGAINAGTGVMTWTNGFSGSVDIQVTASGCNGPSSMVKRTVNITPTVGTPTAITAVGEPTCQLTNGTTTTAYSTTATNNTGFNWSLSSALAGAINAGTGVMTWANGFSGSVDIQVTASGCNGPSSMVKRTVNITPTVGTPTAITSSGDPTCQLTNGTTTTAYSTTATNNTGFNWSLSSALAGAINAGTGVMTWANGFSGSVDIQVTASGCNGPSSMVKRTVNITPTVGTPTAITSSGDPTCQLTNGTTTTVYSTTATNNTGFNWSLSSALAGAINAGTGVMTWANGFSGSVDIQVTASGCNGPSSMVKRTVNITPTVGTPTAITSSGDPTCQLTNGTTTTAYSTTATNNTGFNWSLSSALAGAINAGTGVMTWANGFSGSVDIQVTASGCNGPSSMVKRTVNITPTVGTPTAITSSGDPTCQLTNGTTTTAYSTTATNNTGFNWSLSSALAGAINAGTGVMTWANGFSGSVDIQVTASGCNGPSSMVKRTVNITPTVGTPTAITTSGDPACQLTNGTTTTTYSTTATNNTGFNWSLSSALAGAINAGTGVMTWANGFSGSVDIQVTASGCNGPSSMVKRTVNITPTVGTPTAITAVGEPTCQLTNGTTTTAYSTTATNNTGFNWSLSSALAGAINAGTGVMTWANGFSGSVDIQVTASGCNGPSSMVKRTVNITPTVGTPTAITSSGDPTCQLTNGTTTTAYSTTATNNTGFNWSLSSALAGAINAGTGVMTWANGFSGSVDIQVTANGCNGPSSMVKRTVNITPTVGTPTAITSSGDPTCQLTNGTTTTAYSTTATNNTGFNWSLSSALAGAINAGTGVMTWANGFSGSVDIQVTASGCNGPSSMVKRTVNITPTVGTPTAITIQQVDPTCQLTNGTTTTAYSTTATNNTGFNWSLSSALAGAINAGTGVMTWANGYSGSVDIRVTANGCNGPSAQVIRTVVITPTVGTPTAITTSGDPTCQLTNGTTTTTYSTTATNNTGFNWSLSSALAGAINAGTGVMTWANGFSGQ